MQNTFILPPCAVDVIMFADVCEEGVMIHEVAVVPSEDGVLIVDVTVDAGKDKMIIFFTINVNLIHYTFFIFIKLCYSTLIIHVVCILMN